MRVCKLLMLVGTVIPILTLPDLAVAQDGAANEESKERIVVVGQRPDILLGIQPDTELNENDIAAYGFDTIGDLLDEIASEVDRTGDGPVVLINGELANGVNDVSDLPTEAASKIEILPGTVAARFGQSPTRRVINVVLKPDLAQVTGNADAGLATRGDSFRGAGEVNLLKLAGNNRRSLVFRAERKDGLLESQRGIRPDASGTPYDPVGNIIGAAGFGTEIDPLLSALAGRIVQVAAVPSGSLQPTLADFASGAGLPNAFGAPRFRSLVDDTEVYSLNGNITQRFSAKTSLSLNARIDRSYGDGLSGLTPAILSLPSASPHSPFGRDVALALLLGDALERHQKSTGLNIGATLNTVVGRYTLTASASFNHRVSSTLTDRDYDLTGLQTGIASGSINPFAMLPTSVLGSVRTDRSRSKSDAGDFQIFAAGPLVNLPTGPVRLTTKLGAKIERFDSSTIGALLSRSDSFSRDETNAQVNVSIPLLPFKGIELGSLTADLTYGFRDITVSGLLKNYGGALNWLIANGALNLRGTITDEELPTSPYLLTDPRVVTENYRAYDFLRNETVFVQYISGGNPNLPNQKRRTTQIAAVANPFPKVNLTLTGEYNKIVTRNSIAFLPPANAEVQAIFPDRYIRDASGRLIRLDARPVSYERDESEFLRWGFDFRRTFGGSGEGGTSLGQSDGELSIGSGWRTAVRFDHTWFLNSTRLPRAGLPTIDLLAGGALGYGGGQPRHELQGSIATYHRGIGLQVFGTWDSKSLINSGTAANPSTTVFKARTKFDLRTFANLGPIFPDTPALKGMRVSLEVLNIFDSKQRVVDATGATPLRYQPFLIDPVGRVVQLSLRKVF